MPARRRWVIVAQLDGSTHHPQVYGTWASEELAQQQLARWRARLAKTFGDLDGVPITVEPLPGKEAKWFEGDVARFLGRLRR